MLGITFDDPRFIKYLDRLARYMVGIETIFELRKHKSKGLFQYPVKIKFTQPRSTDFCLPTLTEIQQSLQNTAFQYPAAVHYCYDEMYQQFSAKEHAEIQILSYYLQNPQNTPLINYIGVSKHCCYLCAKLLEQFQVVVGVARSFAVGSRMT